MTMTAERQTTVADVRDVVSIEPLLTVPDVADILAVNADTVRRYIRDKKLAAVALPGYRAGYRIEPAELRRFIASWAADEVPFGRRQDQHLARPERNAS